MLSSLATFGRPYGESWELKLLLSTICHPQTDGQTEVMNKTLSQLLCAVIQKNLKSWEECLPFVEFAYNRTVHSTNGFSPFEIIYGFNPLTPINLIPLPFEERVSLDGEKKAKMVRQLHEGVRLQIEKKNNFTLLKHFKGRKLVVLQHGDWVWVHIHKERFSNQRKSKLQPHGDGPFQILDRINDNAYKIDLSGEYGVGATFNVVDLTLFDTDFDSRSNPFEERGDDVDQHKNTSKDPLHVPNGPMTRSKTKALKEALNALVLNVSTKSELKNSLEYQEETLVHLVHVQEGYNTILFGP
jgi:hypothetical protein